MSPRHHLFTKVNDLIKLKLKLLLATFVEKLSTSLVGGTKIFEEVKNSVLIAKNKIGKEEGIFEILMCFRGIKQ